MGKMSVISQSQKQPDASWGVVALVMPGRHAVPDLEMCRARFVLVTRGSSFTDGGIFFDSYKLSEHVFLSV